MATEKLLGEVFKSAEGKLAHMLGGGWVGGGSGNLAHILVRERCKHNHFMLQKQG